MTTFIIFGILLLIAVFLTISILEDRAHRRRLATMHVDIVRNLAFESRQELIGWVRQDFEGNIDIHAIDAELHADLHRIAYTNRQHKDRLIDFTTRYQGSYQFASLPHTDADCPFVLATSIPFESTIIEG